jgi:hypothetical protein
LPRRERRLEGRFIQIRAHGLGAMPLASHPVQMSTYQDREQSGPSGGRSRSWL